MLRALPILVLTTLTACAGAPADLPDGPDGGAPADGGAGAPHTWVVYDVGDGATGTGTPQDPFRSLQAAIDAASDGDTLDIRMGRYEASPAAYRDPTCGNCGDADFRTPADTTVGFVVRGKSLHLVGASRTSTQLVTGAGYGLLFEDAGDSSLENLEVTGGRRGPDGRATEAAVVVRRTRLQVRDVDIAGNDDRYQGEPDPVVGLIGIAAREGADLDVAGTRILDSSWDGIALYRGDPEVDGDAPHARIVDTRIACTSDRCVSDHGRGVGIGVTWDASAEITGVEIARYWKGIGSFGTSHVVAHNNVVHHQAGWGIVATGDSYMEALNNVIAFNGTTGLAAWNAGASGRFVNNVVVGNGTATSEWVGKKTGVWMNAPETFEFAYNLVWGNGGEDVCAGGTPGDLPCDPIAFAGVDGNLSSDPRFVDTSAYRLAQDSPAIDAGDPSVLDLDGTRSDLGVWGGPDAQAP